MSITRKKLLSLFRSLYRFCALFFAAAMLAALTGAPAKAATDPVAADGAVGVNASWEEGNASTWYIELQRQGIYSVVGGIDAENDAEIRQGLLEFDWGFAHQAADGSFAGTAGGSTGPEFHSTSLFLEAAARATLLLKSYSPTTYTLDQSYYSAKIAAYTTHIRAAAYWFITPSIAAAGQSYNLPFTHRRYLLAATLAEAGAVCSNSKFTDAALPYAEDGISRQLGAGWTAAIPDAVNGVYPPATLLSPGAATPSGTYQVISAVGVDPEQNGYDSEYQCLGLFYLNVYYPYCSDSTVRSELRAATRAGLTWEQQFIDPYGNISITGDSRMGVEKDRDGNIKAPSAGICWGAFNLGYQNTAQSIEQTFAARLAMQGKNVDNNTVHQNGSIDSNEAWESNKSLPWSIGSQKIGVDYVEAGIAEENDAYIRKGIRILNWGLIHMSSNGSFGTSTSLYYGTASFIEAASRAAQDLLAYAPQTYTLTTYYPSWAHSTLTKCVESCNWMTTSSNESRYVKGISGQASHLWAVAAALAETGKFADMANFQADAPAFATDAIALQTLTGEEQENGKADANYQAIGLGYALHYAAASNDPVSVTATDEAANLGLIWEGGNISPAGVVTGTSSPAILTMQRTYDQADFLPDADYFLTVRYRLGGMVIE